jgi:hypothetical protein
MNPMEQVGLIIGIIGGVIGVIGTSAAIVFGTSSHRRSKRQDEAAKENAVKQEATMDVGTKLDIEYIKRGVDDIKIEQRGMREDMNDMKERITRCEESCKSAHHRLDGLEK